MNSFFNCQSKAWLNGYGAFHPLVPLINPYIENTQEYIDWMEGYNMADSHYQESIADEDDERPY